MSLIEHDENRRVSMQLRICGIGLRSSDAELSELLGKWADQVESLEQQLQGAVSETEQLRHEVQARDDVIYHAAEHLRHALDVIAAYEDGITATGGQ